jgi:cellulose synthase/poly-beta-1,6-N-acetylglucosamine synthase-like glycosyltransferase
MIRLLFWASSLSLVYTFVIFPLITIARAGLRPRPYRSDDITPSVSIVIAARNEAHVIAERVRNLVSVDYPSERLEIVLASDGSDDGTPDIARAAGGERVRVLDLPRVGKAAALHAAVDAATGEILVFSDANSMFRPDAVRRLVRPFADPEVGGVAGNQVYSTSATDDATEVGERSYWDFDRRLKVAQSLAGNAIAATGAIYGIRREIFRPIPPGVTDDFYISLLVIDAGRRLVFEPDAVAVEHVAATRSGEYRRKVRIMTRGLRCVAIMRQLLDPRQSGFYSVQLFSHKVLMRTTPIPLLVVALTTGLLATRGRIYALAAVAQAAFYSLGAAGALLGGSPAGRRRLLSLPAYFCLVQVASLHATMNLVRGITYERWEPSRAAGASSPADDGGVASVAEGPRA